MSTERIYSLPVEVTDWKFDGATEIHFNWEYDDGSASLLELYEKGKKQQWDASTRLDWTLELNPDNPMELKDEAISIHGTDYWRKMTDKEKSWLRRELQANSISQFMHGEQGALIATAKIVGTVPDMNAKFYAATQVMDEARHVEAYKRLLHEKFQLAYPINKALKTLLEQTLTDRRWDMTYLGMQVLIEGLALAAFQSIRDKAGNTLAGAVNAYVMQDEARHVSFGRLALREYYPHLSEAERDEREEFVVEALHFMRDRFNQSEVWERLGLPAKVLDEIHYNSKQMNSFRGRLFSRVVPTVKDIGLWGPRVQKAFGEMGHADIVIPYHENVPGKSPMRRAVSKLYTSLVNSLSGYHIRYYNGLALHLRYNVMRWGPYSFGFGFQAELITRLLDEGATFIEVPVTASHQEKSGGQSALNWKNFLSVTHTLVDVLLQEFLHPRPECDGVIDSRIAAALIRTDRDQVTVLLICRKRLAELPRNLHLRRRRDLVHRTADGGLDVDGRIVPTFRNAA